MLRLLLIRGGVGGGNEGRIVGCLTMCIRYWINVIKGGMEKRKDSEEEM